MKKVTVKIPEDKVEDLKKIAAQWRDEHRADSDQKSSKPPGWDAKIISKIANEHFGGFVEMFEAKGWPERGSDMMRKVQKRVKEEYGSVLNFEEKYSK
ncbi:MAG: hypothetical protein ACPGVT_13975 [Maricaulaceae bacterium]